MPGENEPTSALDAINQALGTETSNAVPSDSGNEDSDADAQRVGAEAGSDAGEGDAGAGEGDSGAGENESGDESGSYDDGSEGGEGRVRDPVTGKFVKAEDANAAGDGKQQQGKEGDKAGAGAAAKTPDALNDPIPRDLKPETQQRIRTLIKDTREATERASRAEENFNYMVTGLQATGTTPEQYREVLSFMSLFNSPESGQKQKALELLEEVTDRLAMSLGVERRSSDPLAGHDDLRTAVQQGQMTAKYARELAITRNQSKFNNELQTSARQQEQQQQSAQQELAQARSDLNALEDTLKNSDPDYARKREVLLPVLKPIFNSIRPSEWAAKFQEAYRGVKLPPRAAAPSAPVVPKNQPMRAGKQPAGGQARPAASALDAVNAALGSMK